MKKPVFQIIGFLSLIILIGGFSGCKRLFAPEPQPEKTRTQIRIVNFNNQEVSLNIGKLPQIRPFRGPAVSPYIQRPANVFEEYDLLDSASNRLKMEFEAIQANQCSGYPQTAPQLAKLPTFPDSLNFLFNKTYAFYILPATPKFKFFQGEQIPDGFFPPNYQVIQEEALESFPGKTNLRFINLTTNVRYFKRGIPNSSPPVPPVIPPKFFIIGADSLINKNIPRVSTTNTPLPCYPTNYTEYALLNAKKQKAELLLSNTVKLTYDLDLLSGKNYSYVLTGTLNLADQKNDYGIQLYQVEDGANTPPLLLKPVFNTEASIRAFTRGYFYGGGLATLVDFKSVTEVVPIGLLPPLIDKNSGGYLDTVAGNFNTRITQGGSAPALWESTVRYDSSTSYTIYAVPTISASVVEGIVAREEKGRPDKDSVKIRVINLMLDSAPVDVRLQNVDGPILHGNIQFKDLTQYTTLPLFDANDRTQRLPYEFYVTKAGTVENIIPKPFGAVREIGFRTSLDNEYITLVLTGTLDPDDRYDFRMYVVSNQ